MTVVRRLTVLVGIGVLGLSCRSGESASVRVDLSSPETAAAVLAKSINTGDLKLFEAVAGAGAVQSAVNECEQLKKKRPPEKPTGTDAWAQLGMVVYKAEMARWEQDCASIPGVLKDFLRVMAKGPGIRVLEVRPPVTTDGKTLVEVRFAPPDWDGDRYHRDRVLFAKDVAGKWMPTTGSGGSVANITLEMPFSATWYAVQKL